MPDALTSVYVSPSYPQYEMTSAKKEAARRIVAGNAKDSSDCKQLLDALGLLSPPWEAESGYVLT